MKFLSAKRLVKSLTSDAKSRTVILAANFETESWSVYIQAIYAKQGIRADVQHIDFGSLTLFLMDKADSEADIFTILCPWDVVPSLDWRLGYSGDAHAVKESEIASFFTAVEQKSAALIYIDAPVKPALKTSADNRIGTKLLDYAYSITCPLVVTDSFHLPGYFQTSQPVSGKDIGSIVARLDEKLFSIQQPKKVIVTDLDNTLWQGVIGEAGLTGIQYSDEDEGFPFYLYQSLLLRLKNSGILLVAVSKNDPDLALAPFQHNDMLLTESDFVSVIGSYEAKSSQIKSISSTLDLPTSSFIFVDDNPVEIEEVSRSIPDIYTLKFSTEQAEFTQILATLIKLCDTSTQSEEDSQRTELYRTRMKGHISSANQGSDIESFLAALQMTLTLIQRDKSTAQRALQLINKTNQFNMNGSRLTEAELNEKLDQGAQLWSAQLEDKHGTHGEILACLIERGEITHFVMSCRVLNRHVEYAFLSALLQSMKVETLKLNFLSTERNTPFQKFIKELHLSNSGKLNVDNNPKMFEKSRLLSTEVRST